LLILELIKKNKKIIINSISILIFILLVVYVLNNRDIFEVINNVNPVDFVLIAAADMTIVIFNALLNHGVISRIKGSIRFLDSLLLQFANNFLNKITSHTGLIFRGVYLKGTYNLDLSKFLSTIAGVYIISFGVNSFIGLVSSYSIYRESGIFSLLMILLFTGIFFSCVLLMIVSPEIKNREGFIRRNLGKMLDSWRIIKTKPKMLTLFVLNTVMIAGISALQQYFIFRSIGVEIELPVLFYLASLSSLTILISLTPSGIGIREAVFAFSAQVVDIDVTLLLLSSLLLRVISFFTLFLMGGISYYLLSKRLKDL
jgi:uncharacterized protein (TIRG00374 family)